MHFTAASPRKCRQVNHLSGALEIHSRGYRFRSCKVLSGIHSPAHSIRMSRSKRCWSSAANTCGAAERDRVDFRDELDPVAMLEGCRGGPRCGRCAARLRAQDTARHRADRRTSSRPRTLVLAFFRGGCVPYCELTMVRSRRRGRRSRRWAARPSHHARSPQSYRRARRQRASPIRCSRPGNGFAAPGARLQLSPNHIRSISSVAAISEPAWRHGPGACQAAVFVQHLTHACLCLRRRRSGALADPEGV